MIDDLNFDSLGEIVYESSSTSSAVFDATIVIIANVDVVVVASGCFLALFVAAAS